MDIAQYVYTLQAHIDWSLLLNVSLSTFSFVLVSPSVVELDSTLLGLLSLRKVLPARGESVAEVSHELSLAVDVLHDKELQESDKENDLGQAVGRDLAQAGNTGLDGRELGSGLIDSSRETVSTGSDQVSKDSQHRDTAVLELDVTETVEPCLVLLIDKVERVPESKRFLGSNLVLKGLQRSPGGGLLRGSKGRGNSGKESNDSGGLHHGRLICLVGLGLGRSVWIQKRQPVAVTTTVAACQGPGSCVVSGKKDREKRSDP